MKYGLGSVVAVLLGIAFLAPDLLQYGMSLDGTIYATIAKNLASGVGTPWTLHYTETHFSKFYEQPPFAIWIQSLYFTLIGDAFYVEKLHSIVNLLLVFCVIAYTWRQAADPQFMTPGEKIEINYLPVSYLPLLFFLLIPATHKSFTNNYLDNTLTIFTTASVGLQLAAIRAKRLTSSFLIIAAASFVFLALLIKGPVGLFPIVVIPFYAILNNVYKDHLGNFTLLISVLVILALVLLGFTEAGPSLKHYYEIQIQQSLSGKRQIDHGRVYTIGNIFGSIAYPCVVSFLVWIIIGRPTFSLKQIAASKTALLLLALALASSLPLLASPRQYRHYIIPSLPFYCMYLSVIFSPIFSKAEKVINKRVGVVIVERVLYSVAGGLFIIMCAQSYLLFGKVGKDADYFEVVDYFKDNGIQNQRVLLPQNLRGRDQFEAYLARHLGLSVMSSCNREKCPEYLIKPKGNNQTPGRYTVLVADLSSFEVWSRGGKPNG